jgi:transcriptional regulator with XRE-family HTH domain
MATPIHPVAVKLRARRKALGLSQSNVAAKTGYSAKTIKNWENGHGVPTMRSLIDWCEALGMSLTIAAKEPAK